MIFQSRKDLLSLDELERIAHAFIDRGATKIRITGGEPLVRRDIIAVFSALGQLLNRGLRELTLTTNGTRLAQFADKLAELGVRRVNVSLDTLDPERFRLLTRGVSLSKVLDGIEAARSAGLAVKINVVALRDRTECEIDDLIHSCT